TPVNVTASFVCPGGTTVCNGLCVDTTSDENNCGTCGHVCVAQSCVASMCETTVTQVPVPSTFSTFGFWGATANDVWAVGETSAGGPGVLHWNGTSWTAVSSGVTTTSCGLLSVWGTSATDIWAAGSNCGGGIVTHFDGMAWHQVTQNVTNVPLFGIWAS